MKIEGALLAAALVQGHAALPVHLTKSRATTLMRAIASGDVTGDTESVLSVAFRSMVMRWKDVLTPVAMQLFEDIPVMVLSREESLAIAAKVNEVHVVLITDGFINLIACSLELAEGIEALPEQLKAHHPFEEFPDTDAAGLAAVWLASLLHRFQEDGGKLPRLGHLVPQVKWKSVGESVSGALLWILLHEFGHIVLEHRKYRALSKETQLTDSVVEEEVNNSKLLEQDADSFVRLCLRPEARALIPSWSNFALNSEMHFGSLTSNRPGGHPLVSNRLASVLRDAINLDDYQDDSGLVEHLRQHGRSFESLEKTNESALGRDCRPPFANWTRDYIMQGLELLYPVFRAHGVDLAGVFEAGPIGWRAATTR